MEIRFGRIKRKKVCFRFGKGRKSGKDDRSSEKILKRGQDSQENRTDSRVPLDFIMRTVITVEGSAQLKVQRSRNLLKGRLHRRSHLLHRQREPSRDPIKHDLHADTFG